MIQIDTVGDIDSNQTEKEEETERNHIEKEKEKAEEEADNLKVWDNFQTQLGYKVGVLLDSVYGRASKDVFPHSACFKIDHSVRRP